MMVNRRPWSYLSQGHGGAWMLSALPWLLSSAAFLLTVVSLGAPAHDRARKGVKEVEAAVARLASVPRVDDRKDVATLIAEAELHLRTKHYDLAIDKLNQAVELRAQGQGSATTEADAHFLLGEAYFATEQLYSARRCFRHLTDGAEDPAFAAFGATAASRLVDISLRVQRPDEMGDVLSRIDRMLARGEEVGLQYARGKALFAMGRFAESEEQAGRVAVASEYGQRAAYLRGAALMKLAQMQGSEGPVGQGRQAGAFDYRQAIAAFEQAAVVSGDVARAQASAGEVSDLAWLAVARLHSEGGDDQGAALAYEKIQRGSKYFAEALFEAAWTYVRMGDFARGRRALEALAVLDPGLSDGADGELLRADIFLREGSLDEAQQAYEEVRAKYAPLEQQVLRYLEGHPDPAAYYDKLTAVEVEVGKDLPDLAIDWAREEAEGDRVFAVVDEVARSRSLINRSRRIIALMRASLATGSRAKVFPEVLEQLEDVVGLLNQLAVIRLGLARGIDDVASAQGDELQRVRKERRQLMSRIGGLPTSPGEFSVRKDQADKKWNQVSQSLQRLQLQADHLAALGNGLHRILAESERYGVRADAATLERYRQQVVENEAELSGYVQTIEQLREQVEMGRIQSGLGDDSFQEEEGARRRFNDLLAREVQLAQRSSNAKEASFAKQAIAVLDGIVAVEQGLESRRTLLNDAVMARSSEMQKTLEIEAEAIELYAAELNAMDADARALVGEVARHHFLSAKERIKNVVMRADIGLVQQAWEVREEQKERVRELLRQRAQEERFINDELREVLDDEEAVP